MASLPDLSQLAMGPAPTAPPASLQQTLGEIVDVVITAMRSVDTGLKPKITQTTNDMQVWQRIRHIENYLSVYFGYTLKLAILNLVEPSPRDRLDNLLVYLRDVSPFDKVTFPVLVSEVQRDKYQAQNPFEKVHGDDPAVIGACVAIGAPPPSGFTRPEPDGIPWWWYAIPRPVETYKTRTDAAIKRLEALQVRVIRRMMADQTEEIRIGGMELSWNWFQTYKPVEVGYDGNMIDTGNIERVWKEFVQATPEYREANRLLDELHRLVMYHQTTYNQMRAYNTRIHNSDTSTWPAFARLLANRLNRETVRSDTPAYVDVAYSGVRPYVSEARMATFDQAYRLARDRHSDASYELERTLNRAAVALTSLEHADFYVKWRWDDILELADDESQGWTV